MHAMIRIFFRKYSNEKNRKKIGKAGHGNDKKYEKFARLYITSSMSTLCVYMRIYESVGI